MAWKARIWRAYMQGPREQIELVMRKICPSFNNYQSKCLCKLLCIRLDHYLCRPGLKAEKGLVDRGVSPFQLCPHVDEGIAPALLSLGRSPFLTN